MFGGRNILADALLRMPQCNSIKKEVVDAIMPSNQIATHVTTRIQQKALPYLAEDRTLGIKTALLQDEWFFKKNKENMCTCNGLAWMGSKLYVPDSQ